MRDLMISLGLVGLFIAVMILMGQRNYGLDTINNRLTVLEERVNERTVPRIEISGRAAVYAGSGSITIADLTEEGE